ncbi:MAG TPA: Nif3-like dinuclear metal center hexameric protein [Sporichthyaceae bacterium]|nr:Nif3-like dinuclear metal center hexameric protein [Sporichthyaceae bacterium]
MADPVPDGAGGVRLGAVVEVLQRRYDPALAAAWDAIGLVCGDSDAVVRRVLFAIDPVAAVVDEALEWGADLLVTHHPLFLRPVHGVAAGTPKGRVVHRLITGGCALLVAHTNADAALGGVSDALAAALGLPPGRPLDPNPGPELDKLVAFVPEAAAQSVIDALAAAGAGGIGDYDRCAFTSPGTGTFRPLTGANPTIGSVGTVETVAETRVEMVLPRAARAAVVAALRIAHPYEEPAFDVFEMAGLPGRCGIGRICDLERAESLADFVDRVARGLPATPSGIRVAGEPGRRIRRVAVCGGAGDSLLGAAAAAGADVFLTADLRHHPASEATQRGGCALVDVAHWASEWPWLGAAAGALAAGLGERPSSAAATVEVRVSSLVTDPWTSHTRYRAEEER